MTYIMLVVLQLNAKAKTSATSYLLTVARLDVTWRVACTLSGQTRKNLYGFLRFQQQASFVAAATFSFLR